METLSHVDVVIVGGGWTGLVMAKEIASRTSQSVVVLERGGPARSNAEWAAGMDEVDGLIRKRFMHNIAESAITHRHSTKSQTKPIRQLGGGGASYASGVGGSGELWSAVVSRFLPEQFELATHLRKKYGADKLPPDITIQDWGMTYDEIEPYYWRAEQMLGVGGKAGNIRGKIIEGGNIFEGPRSHEYVNPPHPVPYFSAAFQKAATELGYHPYPQPSANLSQRYRNPDGVERAACEYCGYCGFFGCMVGAKATPTTTMLPILTTKKNFTLRTNSCVRRIVHKDGKAAGVTYIDASGKEVMQPADVVIVASWTLNTVQLLLLSGIGEPYNPDTGKGLVGKNLTQHVLHGMLVFFDKPMNNFMGAGGVGMAIADFAGDPPDADVAAGVFRGGIIRTIQGGLTPIGGFGAIPPGEVTSNWGSDWKKAGLKWYDKSAALSLAAAHFSYKQNFIDLDPTYTDKFGDPLVRITLDWTDHDRREAAMIERVEESLAKAMGAKAYNSIKVVGEHYNLAQSTEPNTYGGAIMGASPETSVVNPWLQHWDIPNLWVVGGSSFPQAEVQGTLTMLATAYRAADALVDRYMKKPGSVGMKRREFITLSMKSLGGVLIYTLAGEPLWLNEAEGTVRVPLRFFTEEEARVISAACGRIFPSDDSGPGAQEAGVVVYIDHQLAGPYGRDEYRYTQGPFVASEAVHGYGGKENPQEMYRAGLKDLGADFAGLSAADQDARLRGMEKGLFFQMLRSHTVEGMFCDPMHGGNANLIGWQMIGFPGPRMSYRKEIGVYNKGEAWRVKPKSLQQLLGRPVKGWEEEGR